MENEKKQQQTAAGPRQPGQPANMQRAGETDARPRLPYEAPAVEVTEVQTERGYAGSAGNFGNGGRW